MGAVGDGLEIANFKRWVGHRFAEESAGFVVGGRSEVGWVVGVHEAYFDAEGDCYSKPVYVRPKHIKPKSRSFKLNSKNHRQLLIN